jgi:hypothetical protein
MNSTSAKSPPAGLAGATREVPPPSGDGPWTRGRWLTWIALIFAAHAALVFAFGGRKPIVPHAVKDAPVLNLAAAADERLALNDPTLFALPHRKDFASASRKQMPVEQPSFHWTEPPGWLPLSAEQLGAVFNEFMQTNGFPGLELQLKPPLKLSTPELPITPVLAQNSTLLIEGDLAQRPLLNPVNVPSLPYHDVIAPSKVQVLVDPVGNVISTVLLPSDNPLEAAGHYADADRRALELARAARFAPGPRLALGRLIFNWHTVPMTNTNEPPESP